MFQGILTITGGHFPPPILKIQPGDVIIIQSPHRLSREHMDHIGKPESPAATIPPPNPSTV
jgi:hypothetical protein